MAVEPPNQLPTIRAKGRMDKEKLNKKMAEVQIAFDRLEAKRQQDLKQIAALQQEVQNLWNQQLSLQGQYKAYQDMQMDVVVDEVTAKPTESQ